MDFSDLVSLSPPCGEDEWDFEDFENFVTEDVFSEGAVDSDIDFDPDCGTAGSSTDSDSVVSPSSVSHQCPSSDGSGCTCVAMSRLFRQWADPSFVVDPGRVIDISTLGVKSFWMAAFLRFESLEAMRSVWDAVVVSSRVGCRLWSLVDGVEGTWYAVFVFGIVDDSMFDLGKVTVDGVLSFLSLSSARGSVDVDFVDVIPWGYYRQWRSLRDPILDSSLWTPAVGKDLMTVESEQYQQVQVILWNI